MNILYICNDMTVSGSPKAIVTEVIELKNNGFNVVVASRTGPMVKELEKHNIKHYEIDMPIMGKCIIKDSDKISIVEYLSFLKNAFWRLRILRAFSMVKKIVKSNKIDIIQAHQPGPTLVAYLVAKRRIIPLILRIQHVVRNEFPYPFYKSIVSYSSKISVITKEIEEHLIRVFNIDPKKIKIIPTAVKFKENNSITSIEKKIDNKKGLDILTISTLGVVKYRAVLTLLKAVKMAIEGGINCNLTIIGDGPYRKQIEATIKELNLCENVTMVGEVQHVVPYIMDHEVIVGVGRVAMEALYFGKLLLCCSHFSYAGLFDEKSSESISSFNFSGRNLGPETLNPEKIFEDIKKIVDLDLDTIYAMKSYNQKFFRENFSVENIMSNTISMFKEALNNKF
ncbi:glycosyltransferase [Bacillus alveayuensis]|uniref:glycosyltransferase n=1 Tax=Aeribacillus alveayuensis TaxID=279215 RepID=UPI0005CCB124|nr:glycosyltransferase [Bacillus alveayuensis]